MRFSDRMNAYAGIPETTPNTYVDGGYGSHRASTFPRPQYWYV
jgi:hypothetical protein